MIDAFPLQVDAPQKPPRKGAKVAPSEGTILQVVLHDTIIFPEGGGQPSDVGFISVGPDTTLEVFESKRVGGHAVHSVRFPTPDELQKVQLLIPTGTNVVVTLGDAGYRRRLDHVSESALELLILTCPFCLDDTPYIPASPFRDLGTTFTTPHPFLVSHRSPVPMLHRNTPWADPRRDYFDPG